MSGPKTSAKAIFLQALELTTVADLKAYLDTQCGSDDGLRREVEELLRHHLDVGSFLELPPTAVMDSVEQLRSMAPQQTLLDFLTPSTRADSLGRLAHYEILEVVGTGGMGIVLKAFDEHLQRIVAIKTMAASLATSATARQRFVREARAAAAVNHDNVVDIYAVEGTGPVPYLVMKYVAGISLEQRLHEQGALDLKEILRIGLQTADGLAAAHRQGVVHRDVKPGNILLENGVGRVKITDFGLARAADDASDAETSIIAGTPAYMSPEQARGDATDHRSDLFSLGSVLYALCTGQSPFRSSSPMGTLKLVCEQDPPPIRELNPDVPDWLCAVIEKLHKKDPAERFQTAAELAETLGAYLAHVQQPSNPLPPAIAQGGQRARGGEGERGRTIISHSPTLPLPPSPTLGLRRWALASIAAVFLLCVTLSLTEAGGVTHLAATVIRIITPDGTLIVETDDPAVKVTVEGDGGLVITGAGLEEIRLRPGSYRVHADKHGRPIPLDKNLVTVDRGGRAIVKVKLEPPAAAAPANVERGAFVLFTGGKEWQFDTLFEAALGAADGDTIEVRGNGPFVTEPVPIGERRALTIRAANGFRPVLQLARAEVDDYPYLLSTNGPLVLEGLEIRCERRPSAKSLIGYSAVNADAGSLHVANCRFVAPYRHSLWAVNSRRVVVRNCEFLSSLAWSDGLAGRHASDAVWKLDNCVQIGGAAVSCAHTTPEVSKLAVRIHQCSLINCVPTYFTFRTTPKDPESGLAARLMRVDLSESLTDTGQLLAARWHKSEALPSLIGWRGSNNVYQQLGIGPPTKDPPIDTQEGLADGVKGVNDLESWRKFWDSPETGSIEGEIRYQGGDLAGRLTTAPEQITPHDFRLREDSAGYRAGRDGKDLGADVDLLGPGAAYERWKKTPEYQEWLKETEQMK